MDDQRMDAAIKYLDEFFAGKGMEDYEGDNGKIGVLMDEAPGWVNCSEGIAYLTRAIRLARKPVPYFCRGASAHLRETEQRERMLIAAMTAKHMLGGRP